MQEIYLSINKIKKGFIKDTNVIHNLWYNQYKSTTNKKNDVSITKLNKLVLKKSHNI